LPEASSGIVIVPFVSDINTQMPTRPLLPGVTADSCPPAVVCDAHAALRKARRRAWLRDALQIALLIAVDWLFAHWPESRLPFADRGLSLTMLRGMNAGIAAHLWLSRALPRWRARRVAATWSRSEREKFLRQVA
jgi:hypothetical protein